MLKFAHVLFVCPASISLSLSLSVPVHAQNALVLQKLNEWNDAAPAPERVVLVEQVRGVAMQKYADEAACLAGDPAIEKVQPATADRYVFGSVARRQMRNGWFVTARLPGCESAPVRLMTT